MSSFVQLSSTSLRGVFSLFKTDAFVSSLQPMTLREWTLDPSTLALVGPDDIDRPMAYWFCMYGNCHRTEEACARCYQSRHTLYSWACGGMCAKTYAFKHRRASIQCRWHWYLIDHIDLHSGATTLDLHQAALRRLKRRNGDYED